MIKTKSIIRKAITHGDKELRFYKPDEEAKICLECTEPKCKGDSRCKHLVKEKRKITKESVKNERTSRI